MESTSDLYMAVSKWTKWCFLKKREVSWKVDSKKRGSRRQGLYMFCNNLSFDSCQFCCLTLGSMWWGLSKVSISPCPPPVVISTVRCIDCCVLYRKNQKLVFFFLLCHMAVWFLVPIHGWNLCPLQWKHMVLTTGPQGICLKGYFCLKDVFTSCHAYCHMSLCLHYILYVVILHFVP